ncbi:CBS domain-containing protein [Paraburkholderia solisilvae]|uniref:Inosine-5'-monophosphate dehydrogenase n=1 Tax=Paraburkholderia solisilvae TaxID=624376 RepID=A0A6J5DA05_9BURK|nr:CBS domain-containing protein [Paraburkholderia solisilvae]CAB3751139.1 Inosine-5'-monophosphate dehydrogenase [Paraburkholderia solisilvae]
MRALDIMTTPVVTTTPDTTIHEAAKLLADHRISGMPVLDAAGNVVGIISEGDLLHRVETGTDAGRRSWWLDFVAGTRELAARYVKEHGHKVGDVMSENVISIHESTPLKEIADLLERHRIKRVPVLREDRLVGIVSRSNLIRALAALSQPDTDADSYDDAALRDAIVAALAGYRWALPKGSVFVKDGIVHLWGVIESEQEGRAICVAAERVSGVKGVESHLAFPVVIPAM